MENIENLNISYKQVLFNPSKDYGDEYANSAALQRHFMTSAIRLHMKTPSDTQPESSYYAIADPNDILHTHNLGGPGVQFKLVWRSS